MPNYVDYSTEDMNGTPVHTFVDANGQPSPPLFGPEADGLAQNISQFKAYRQANGGPDMRVAGPGGGMSEDPNMSVAPEADGGMSSNPGAGAAPQPTPSAGPPAPGYSQADADAARTAQTPIGPPTAPGFAEQQQADANAQAIHNAARKGNLAAAGADPSAFINAPVVTKGVSREDLQKKAAGAVAIPKTGEETVEAASPYDTDAAEARANANLDLRLVKQQQAEALAQRAERDAQVFDQQAAIAAVRMQHEQQKQQLVDDGVQQDAAAAREFRDQVAKQQVDPGRLFSGDLGAFHTVSAVIGNALGAFAAAGGGSPTVNGRRAAAGGTNYAGQIINAAIERDIRAQEVNIRTNQENSANQLNDIYRRLGDMNQAKTVLRQMQQDYAGLQMKSLAAKDGSQDAVMAHQEWEASNAADRAEQERKFLADSYGKHTIKVAQSFVSPQAGGERMPTYQEQLAKAEALAKFQGVGLDQEQKSAELDKTRAEAGKLKAEAANGSPQAQADYNKNIQFVESGEGALQQIIRGQGGEYDARTGKVTWGNSDVPGSGIASRVTGIKSGAAKGLEKAIALGAPAIEKGVEGDAAGEAGIKQIQEGLTSGDSDTRRAAAEAMAGILAARRRSAEASGTPALRSQRNGQRLQSSVDAQGGGVRSE
jgi:hypothetical protein